MELKSPIILVGSGRSGSSVFHEILANHPNLAWLPAGCERYPEKPDTIRRIMVAADFPLVGRLVRRRFHASEVYGFWNHYFPGFATPFRDLTEDDVTRKAMILIRQAIAKIPTQRRNRIVMKITGWPRIGFLKEVFPDARFVHIVRDGRAVANSLLNVTWWWGWRGPLNWRFGLLDDDEQRQWESQSESFVALAGIQWNKIMRAMELGRRLVPAGSWYDLRYEDLCADPARVISQVIDFAGLPRSEDFLRFVRRQNFRSANEKWREELTPKQQTILEEVTCTWLRHHGYM